MSAEVMVKSTNKIWQELFKNTELPTTYMKY